MIEILSHDRAEDLISNTAAYLETRESEHNLPLGLMYGLAGNPQRYGVEPPVMLSVMDRGRAVGMAILTHGRKLILSRFEAKTEDAVIPLVRHLHINEVSVPGVVGPEDEARVFSDFWVEAVSGASSRLTMRMRAFEIREAAGVPLSAGTMRLASMDDHALMARWTAEFSEQIGEPTDPEAAAVAAERFIQTDQLYIWDSGGPVSMAKTSRSTRNGISINGVYTPAEHRNKGYATSCVWSLTKKLLSDGYSFCSLFTDQLNPTSNSIYTNIGYRPVGDALTYDFVYSASSGSDEAT
ncbi:MAG: GNAT family N-acetyltransferase [Gemmatimonadota bacterium]|nr:GNAT family N-acetyltransferase [Gemmatimonadota bacterium]